MGPGVTVDRSDVTVDADLDRLVEATPSGEPAWTSCPPTPAALVDVTPEHVTDTFDQNVGGTVFMADGW